MNKKQLIVAFIVVLLLIIVFGLGVMGRESLLADGTCRWDDVIVCYEMVLFSFDNERILDFFVGNDMLFKSIFTIPILIIGGLLIYSLRDKKK